MNNVFSNQSIADQNTAAVEPEVVEAAIQATETESYTSTETGREIPVPEAAQTLSDEVSEELEACDMDEHSGQIGQDGVPLTTTMIDGALEFLAQYDEIAKAMAQHGAENLGKVLHAIGDPMVIAQMIKKIQSQVTKGVYWEFVKAELAQQRAARLAGGGVNGREISSTDFFLRSDDYPANEGHAATPGEMLKALDEVYVTLSEPFAQIATALGWDTTLPYTSMETAGGWIAAINVEQAFSFLDKDRESKAKQREMKTQAVVANLANLKI